MPPTTAPPCPQIKRMAWFVQLAWIALTMLNTGCATSLRSWVNNDFKVGPNYCQPAAPVGEHWIDFQTDSRLSESLPDLAAWWTVFNDPQLDALMHSAAQQNISLRIAGTRIQQAQAIRAIAVGSLFPQAQFASGGYDRIQLSRTTANVAPNSPFNQWDSGLNLSWELDFWGRYRRGIESADASLDATIESYDNVMVLLLSDVATSYIRIRTLQRQLTLLKENVELQKNSLKIAEARLKGGLSDEVDVLQTRNNVEQTESLIPVTEASIRQASHALCVLLGWPPRDLAAELGEAHIPRAPQNIAVAVPAELLRRRPDVRQAERIAAAQCAKIGIAETDLYPRIAISGALQWQSESLDQLFTPRSFGGAVGPSFTWNILNYGRLKNAIRLQQALFDQEVYTYQNVVLNAQREAEDAMVGFVKAQDQAEKLSAAVRDVKELESILLTKAQKGAIDFNRVFVVQAQATSQQDNLAVSEGNIALNLVRVYRALGGGWEIRLQEDYLPTEQIPPSP